MASKWVRSGSWGRLTHFRTPKPTFYPPRRSKMAFFGLKCTLNGVSGFRGSVGGPGVCKPSDEIAGGEKACWSVPIHPADPWPRGREGLRCHVKHLVVRVLYPEAPWDSLAPLQGSFGPFGPKVGKRVRKWVPGASAPGPKKSKTESKKSQNRLFFNYFDFFSTPSSTFGPLGREAPGTHFGLFFQLWARRAQMTPVAGKSFRKRPQRLRWHLWLERPCVSQEGGSMLLRRGGGFLRSGGGFLRSGGGFLRRGV